MQKFTSKTILFTIFIEMVIAFYLWLYLHTKLSVIFSFLSILVLFILLYLIFSFISPKILKKGQLFSKLQILTNIYV